jgi:hypothetical protein
MSHQWIQEAQPLSREEYEEEMTQRVQRGSVRATELPLWDVLHGDPALEGILRKRQLSVTFGDLGSKSLVSQAFYFLFL